MATSEVKSLSYIRGKTPPLVVLPHRYISSVLSKKSILTALKFIAIIVKTVKFDAKAYFIINRGQHYQVAPPVKQRYPILNAKTFAFSALALVMLLEYHRRGKGYDPWWCQVSPEKRMINKVELSTTGIADYVEVCCILYYQGISKFLF